MRRLIILTLIVLIGAVLVVGGASCARTKTQGVKKAKTLSAKDYDSPEICATCHGEIAAQWKDSMHADSWKDPLYQAVYKELGEKTGGKTDEFCASCHTPIGVLTKEVPPRDGSKMSAISTRGVQCDFCHTVKELKGIGNFSVISSPGEVKLGPLVDPWIPSHAFHKSKYSKLHTRSDFCGACHKVNHPVNKLQIENTYGEWKASEYAKAGITCQDCHMTPGPGVTKPNPGQAAVDGPKRKHIYSHRFTGGNAAVPGLAGIGERVGLAEGQLKAAASVEIIDGSLNPGERATLTVKVNNTGAGHYLPTGATEFRQMWLYVSVVDAKGSQIFVSGDLDRFGMLSSRPVVYQTVVGDADGKATHNLWEAAKILSDKRIPPKGSSDESYEFDLPAEAQSPITVTAVLRYRSISQEIADNLLGQGRLRVPVIDMASAERTF